MVRPNQLLEQVRNCIRTRHLAYRTEKTYLYWIRRFLSFHGQKDPRQLGAEEVGAFLTSLAVDNKVAASTQNQALAAVLFLYRDALGLELPWLADVVRAKRPVHLPVVLSRSEVQAVLARSGWWHPCFTDPVRASMSACSFVSRMWISFAARF
jgi:integrase